MYRENPIYLGVTLDRTLNYRAHIIKTKAKVNTRNNLLNKLANTMWGANATTLRTTALSLSFCTAEYACLVWGRSVHAHKLDSALNTACRQITGCLKPTPISNLYLLSGIAPPDIRRKVTSHVEKVKQVSDCRHPLHGHQSYSSRLKTRFAFITAVSPLVESAEDTRLTLWKEKLRDVPDEEDQCHPQNTFRTYDSR